MTDSQNDFKLERYRYILQQLHATNESVHRYLAIYQTLATALAGGALLVFISRSSWNLSPDLAEAGIVGLLILLSLVGLFSSLLVIMSVLTWLDYRREECDLTDEVIGPGFRTPPDLRNFIRWHETYIVLFILGSLIAVWALALAFLLPAIR